MASPQIHKYSYIENMEVNTIASNMITINRNYGLMGLSEHLLREELGLIAESKRVELDAKWKKLHHTKVHLKRT